MESPSFTDAHPSPTSLPGRDPLADADTTLIRKRQRLTPTQLGGEDWFSAGRSESPLQIDIIPPEQELAPTAAIYIMGDEDLTAGYIESFPGVTDQRRPEHLAASFANSCYDSKGPSLYRIDQFADWIQDHVSATSASQNYSSYVQDRVFWYHVGRCFEGLAKRRYVNTVSDPSFYRTVRKHRGKEWQFTHLHQTRCSPTKDFIEPDFLP